MFLSPSELYIFHKCLRLLSSHSSAEVIKSGDLLGEQLLLISHLQVLVGVFHGFELGDFGFRFGTCESFGELFVKIVASLESIEEKLIILDISFSNFECVPGS
jgi:hypothetical protein